MVTNGGKLNTLQAALFEKTGKYLTKDKGLIYLEKITPVSFYIE